MQPQLARAHDDAHPATGRRRLVAVLAVVAVAALLTSAGVVAGRGDGRPSADVLLAMARSQLAGVSSLRYSGTATTTYHDDGSEEVFTIDVEADGSAAHLLVEYEENGTLEIVAIGDASWGRTDFLGFEWIPGGSWGDDDLPAQIDPLVDDPRELPTILATASDPEVVGHDGDATRLAVDLEPSGGVRRDGDRPRAELEFDHGVVVGFTIWTARFGPPEYVRSTVIEAEVQWDVSIDVEPPVVPLEDAGSSDDPSLPTPTTTSTPPADGEAPKPDDPPSGDGVGPADPTDALALGGSSGGFGNQPGGDPTATDPGFWASIAGPASQKVKGDAFQAGDCTMPADGCIDGVNVELRPGGYVYAVQVTASEPGQTLAIEVFDPAFVHVGDNCFDVQVEMLLSGATAAADPAHPDHAWYRPEWDPADARSTEACTGDQRYLEGADAPWTTFTVLAPDRTSWDLTDNPVVDTAACRPANFEPVDFARDPFEENEELDQPGALWRRLVQQDAAGEYARSVFRQWVTVCEIPDPVEGQYLLRVQTDVDSQGHAHLAGGGANRYSLRAALRGATDDPVAVRALDGMSIYVSDAATGATFPLARVTPGAAGRTLVVDLFDVADGNGSGTLRIGPPADAVVDGAPIGTFGGCAYMPPPGSDLAPTGDGCAVEVTLAAGFSSGQWIRVEVPIPEGYDCDEADPMACWVTISYDLSGRINDTTTWVAHVGV
jgi:hypothetical protein